MSWWKIAFWVVALGIAFGAVIALDNDAHRPIGTPLTPVTYPPPSDGYGER